MAVDNPSYFSLQGADVSAMGGSSATTARTNGPTSSSSTTRSFGGFFRRGKSDTRGERGPAPKSPVISSNSSQRRSFRNLFRSASARADCERTSKFLKGEPRPSDVAPPSPYLNERSHVHTDSSRCKLARRRAPKSPSELLHMDMVFCGLPGENGAAVPRRNTQENEYYRYERDSDCASEATTLALDDAEDERSYYNITATLPALGSPAYSTMGRRRQYQVNGPQQRRRRRHSIGTFLDGDKCAISAAMASRKQPNLVIEPTAGDVVDHANECPRLGRVNRPDRFGTRHAPAAFPSEANGSRDDVIFISSRDNEASALWVNYLTACFEQISRQQGRPPFRVSQVPFEEPLSSGSDLKVRNSRLQIVVVCPVFLERVAERPEHASALSRQLSADRVLAMMLGVQDGHLSSVHRASLVAYPSWRKFFVKDQDETFVGQFLGAAVAILGNVNAAGGGATNNLKIDKTGFSVHPKKVKTGANRILAMLNEPLQPDDSVTVMVDRCGEAIELSHVKRRNPYVLQFSIPERCLDVSMLVGVRIARNGTPLGVRQVKCESRLRELDQILRAHDNPLEFMCQTFGFHSGDREQLDNWMVHAFQKNIPPHFNLLSNPSGDLQLSKNHSSSEENPTLLHFAARFGLEKLAWQLLECPGSDIACDMRNTNDYTPADLAEQAGHVKLAHQLRSYMQMNEFSNMYSYLKVMSENANGSANGYRTPHQGDRLQPMSEESSVNSQEDYCRPRPLSEAYSVPPTARPVMTHCLRTFPDYSTPPPLPQPNPLPTDNEDASSIVTAPIPTPTSMLTGYSSNATLNASSLELPLQGYMQMNLTGLRSPDSVASSPTVVSSCSQLVSSPTADTPTTETKSECIGGSSDQLSTKSSTTGRSSQSSVKSRDCCPQDELLEIITDFKNNVFTISEVERLVENWRNRNDVQQSFKDKQRQLSAMRDEYERIQKRIKDDMKAPTPFDRIKKFFTKGKKDSKDSAGSTEDTAPNKPNGVNSNLADRRPVSSLSLHSVSSSSSSGRMSTVSGCSGTSLGDSGTHSDTEDRRLQHPASEDKAAGITSYEIPPAPKPFHGRLYQQVCNNQRYTPSPARSGCGSASNSELDLRAVKSSHSITDDKEYYIAFPPSGLPIHSFKSNVKELKTSSTPIDLREFSFNDKAANNYANVAPILQPPPGMCIPFQYVNLKAPTTTSSKPPADNVLTIQPEIHSEPAKLEETTSNDDEDDEDDDVNEEKSATPDSPKILNTESKSQLDYTNIQVAASEEIARNFGVTLKKLPVPPVPPRCEFNFANADGDQVKAAKTTDE